MGFPLQVETKPQRVRDKNNPMEEDEMVSLGDHRKGYFFTEGCPSK